MSLTQEQFLQQYHDYQTYSQEEAVAKVIKLNQQGIEGDIAAVVFFGEELGYTIMLKSAIDSLMDPRSTPDDTEIASRHAHYLDQEPAADLDAVEQWMWNHGGYPFQETPDPIDDDGPF